jgi:hypothetical protein
MTYLKRIAKDYFLLFFILHYDIYSELLYANKKNDVLLD